ncbi:MAG TPA: hypothetical protein VGI56_09960 [Galbitalea sp.]
MSEFPASVIRDLKKRSRGLCEGCGVSQATQAHHRQYRSRGGSDLLSNALHLCGSGNHTGCHGIAHTAAGEALGWSIRSGFDPEEVPVFHKFGGTWTRQPEGSEPVPINQYDAREYMVSIHAIKAVG